MEAATATPTTTGHQRLVALAEPLPQQHGAARELGENIRTTLAA
ncbi:hypothetical protein ACIO1C_34495 [Streptomyces sp. NPDC087420]